MVLLTTRFNMLISVIILQAWTIYTVTAQENQMTRHQGHTGHDTARMRWDHWTDWTSCSVNCGRGITTRSRDCRSMLDGRVTAGCSGRSKEIKICEFTGCLREAAEMAECKKLESRVFGGKRYRWKPYKHPREECKQACRPVGGAFYLEVAREECKQACRPVGGAFYLEVGKNVSDGSVCGGEKQDHLCIGGKCRRVGCDNVVESDTVHDNCGVCGGDNTSCTMVSKTFTDTVRFGYHTLDTIPRGATKIFISEAIGARNYLGVRATDKSFSINTDFRLSRFGDIPGAGTIFKYRRQAGPDCPDECIRADGPLEVPLDIVVLFYSSNRGISYSYFLSSDAVVDRAAGQEDAVVDRAADKDDAVVDRAPGQDDAVVDRPADKDAASPDNVHINGGSIPGKLGEDESKRVKGDKKRPIFSSDFKFKKNSRRRKHRQHRKRNRNRENETRKSDKINVTGDTGALNKHKTKTQSTVTNENSFIITYKNDSIVIKPGRTKPDNSNNRNVHDNNNRQDNELNVDTTTKSTKQYAPTDSFIEQNGGDAEEENEGNHNGIVEDDLEDKPPVENKVDGEESEEVENKEERDDDVSDENEDQVDESIQQDKSTQAPAPAAARVTDSVTAGVADGDMYSNDNRGPSLYSWIIASYSECSQTCGKGKQTAIIQCIVTDKNAYVDGSFCEDLEKPFVDALECSNGGCPPSWTARPWSKCTVTCGFGTQTRDYVCQSLDGELLSEFNCASPKPSLEERTCDLGSCAHGWYFTEWENECVAQCDYGTVSRRVHCSSDSGNINTACNQRDKPEVTKSCRNDDCGGFWVTGPWSKCNATCGMAYQTRQVTCATKQQDRITIVTESACQDEEKPPTYMSCDLERCGATWFMTEWGDCSASCGTGQQTRDVRCLDDNFLPSSDCDKDSKPADRESCSSNRPCPLADESSANPDKTPKPNKPSKPSKQTPPTAKPEESPKRPDCEDKFSQCEMVLKNRLCQYRYYQKICCESCVKLRKKL